MKHDDSSHRIIDTRVAMPMVKSRCLSKRDARYYARKGRFGTFWVEPQLANFNTWPAISVKATNFELLTILSEYKTSDEIGAHLEPKEGRDGYPH